MSNAVVKTSKVIKGMTSNIRTSFDVFDRARDVYLAQIKRAEGRLFRAYSPRHRSPHWRGFGSNRFRTRARSGTSASILITKKCRSDVALTTSFLT